MPAKNTTATESRIKPVLLLRFVFSFSSGVKIISLWSNILTQQGQALGLPRFRVFSKLLHCGRSFKSMEWCW